MLYACMLLQDSLLWRKSPCSQLSLLSGTSTAENTELPNLVLNDFVFKWFDFYFLKSETAKQRLLFFTAIT